MEIKLQKGDVCCRNLKPDDTSMMVLMANNERVSRNLRDGFPHPYTLKDAENFIHLVETGQMGHVLAIEYQGNYVGNIGLIPGQDVYHKSAELGYFIGEPYWNKGITTVAVTLMTDYCFTVLKLVRVWAGVFEYNTASQRVLEKCGFTREAVYRMAVVKNGIIWDEIRYARLNPALEF